MPLLNQIGSALDVVRVMLWTFALLAFTHALFRSFLAAEIAYWLRTGAGATQDRRLHVLQWELRHKTQWSTDLEAGSPHAAVRRLTAEQLAARGRALERLARGTLLRRAARQFGTCLMCQAFWSALAACYLFGDAGAGAHWAIASALCYAGLAVALSQAIGRLGPNGRRPSDEGGCKDGDCMH
jgi:hypothetical protein